MIISLFTSYLDISDRIYSLFLHWAADLIGVTFLFVLLMFFVYF